MCGISIAIVELFSTIVQIGMPQRTAVSKSSPVMPNAASPMKLTQNLSGAATFAPIVKPEPGAELVRLAPAQITARPRRAIERQQLLARAAGIVRDDRVRPDPPRA